LASRTWARVETTSKKEELTLDVNGKIALVTGAASGIGFAIARALAEEGSRVILADIDRDELGRAAAAIPGAETIVLDVTNRDQWAIAGQRFGAIDILVNNAGIGPDGFPLADMDAESFDRIIRINLTGVFNGISTFAAAMRDRGSGHIVNTASMAGLTASARLGGYAAAKFAVVGMSEVLRAEMLPHGVGVSVLCPGYVPTRLAETTGKAGSAVPSTDLSSTTTTPLDAAIVGRLVVDAIRSGKPLVVTHGEYRGAVEARLENVLVAFDGVPASTDY